MNKPATDSNQNLVRGPKCGFTPRETGQLTVGRKVTLILTDSKMVS
jgi:hypothetical protein